MAGRRLTNPVGRLFERAGPENGSDGNSSWARVPATFRKPDGSLPQPWEGIFGPLRRGPIDDLVVVGQSGQSIDGRIATPTGHSHYINGEAGLAHLHRLRALVDAVVIGVGTAIADDPQLTVRRVEGPSPARVIVDPNGRLPLAARVLTADGIRRLVVTGDGTRIRMPQGVEIVPLAAGGGCIAPEAILAALAHRGFRRILIEGGADTVTGCTSWSLRSSWAQGHRVSRCRRSSGSKRRCARRSAPMCSAKKCCSTAISALSACRSAGRRCRRDPRAGASGLPPDSRAAGRAIR